MPQLLVQPSENKGMSIFIKPPFWQASAHTTIPSALYQIAAEQVLDRWFFEASSVETLGQARRDLARLSFAAANVGEHKIAREARLWHKRLPLKPPLREPLASSVRCFFSEVNESDDLIVAIAASARALSVFDQNEIDFRAEEIAADEDNIFNFLSGVPSGQRISQLSADFARILRHINWI